MINTSLSRNKTASPLFFTEINIKIPFVQRSAALLMGNRCLVELSGDDKKFIRDDLPVL